MMKNNVLKNNKKNMKLIIEKNKLENLKERGKVIFFKSVKWKEGKEIIEFIERRMFKYLKTIWSTHSEK